MDRIQWITLLALSLLLVEGFVLSVFPTQFKQFLVEADPRALQVMGWFESIVALALISGIVIG